ncbi:MAG: OmpP1/FadL family transporter, partial [Chitinivibrionales bacterium]
MTQLHRVAFAIVLCALALRADDPAFTMRGVGARAMAMGNAYVALSNDFSAVYWNPAGLGYTPVREFQIGIEGIKLETGTTFGSVRDDIDKNRMRLSHAGTVQAIPASRGGFSFAIGFSSPVTFDNAYSFHGNDRLLGDARIGYYWLYDDDGNQIPDTLRRGESLYYHDVTNTAYGQLRMINLAAGWQVGPGLSFGFSVNPIFGKIHERLRIESFRKPDGDGLFQNSLETYTRSFSGIDMRLGMLFRPDERVSVGARLDLPQYLRMKMDYELVDSTYDMVLDKSSDEITLSRPFTGAAGIACMLPIGTMSVEATFRAPFFEAAEHSDQAYFRVGGS